MKHPFLSRSPWPKPRVIYTRLGIYCTHAKTLTNPCECRHVAQLFSPCNRHGERKKRKDYLEDTIPLALAHIAQSIMRRTQPSPCAVKTKHDFVTRGQYHRSAVDNSLVCKQPDLCRTEGVRYMMGTQQDLFVGCMAGLESAVSLRT